MRKSLIRNCFFLPLFSNLYIRICIWCWLLLLFWFRCLGWINEVKICRQINTTVSIIIARANGALGQHWQSKQGAMTAHCRNLLAFFLYSLVYCLIFAVARVYWGRCNARGIRELFWVTECSWVRLSSQILRKGGHFGFFKKKIQDIFRVNRDNFMVFYLERKK